MALTTIKEEPERKETKVMYWSTLPNNPFRMMDNGFRLGDDITVKTYAPITYAPITYAPTQADTKGDDDTE